MLHGIWDSESIYDIQFLNLPFITLQDVGCVTVGLIHVCVT